MVKLGKILILLSIPLFFGLLAVAALNLALYIYLSVTI